MKYKQRKSKTKIFDGFISLLPHNVAASTENFTSQIRACDTALSGLYLGLYWISIFRIRPEPDLPDFFMNPA